jgi:hypothetical protein
MMAAALRSLAVAACCAGLAAMLLMVLDPGTAPSDGRHLAVFRQDRSVRLDSVNLVDFLTSVEFAHKIRRVRWTNSALAVDFTVRSGGTADSVYSDLKALIAHAFGHTANVRRLLVRFEAEDDRDTGGRPRLLLAADVRRSDPWIAGHWAELEVADPGRDRVWRERLRITASPVWDERFGQTGSDS